MKLKLLKTPRSGQADMLVTTSKGTREFSVGKVVELSDDEGQEVLASTFGLCFERQDAQAPESKAEPVKAATKVVGPNKSSRKQPSAEDEAMEEATKMVDDYATKG